MRITYIGESKPGKGDRLAEIRVPAEYESIVWAVLDTIYPEYSSSASGDDDEAFFIVSVDDKADYDWFSRNFRADFKAALKGGISI